LFFLRAWLEQQNRQWWDTVLVIVWLIVGPIGLVFAILVICPMDDGRPVASLAIETTSTFISDILNTENSLPPPFLAGATN